MNRLPLYIIILLSACGTSAGNASDSAVANQTEAPAAVPITPPADARAAGRYSFPSPDEVVELLLHPDGRFEFAMAAGALNLTARGRWASDGRTVTLNTEPRPRPAAFSAGPVTRDPDAPVTVRVVWPDGNGIALINVLLGFADGRRDDGYTQEDGWSPSETGTPQWIELSLPMYGIQPQRFSLDSAQGNHFTFTLTPNDMHIADFRDRVLEINGRDLLLLGGDGGSMTFRRQD